MTGQGEATPAVSARHVALLKAALETILRAAAGWPHVSLASVRTDHHGAPLRARDRAAGAA